MSQFRGEIPIDTKTFKRLEKLAKAQGKSVDQVAEKMLNQILEELEE